MGELVDRRLGPRGCKFLYLRRVAGLKCCADVMFGPENIDDRARPGTVGLEGDPWTVEDVRRNVKGEFFLQTKDEEDEEGGGGGGEEEICRPKRNAVSVDIEATCIEAAPPRADIGGPARIMRDH